MTYRQPLSGVAGVRLGDFGDVEAETIAIMLQNEVGGDLSITYHASHAIHASHALHASVDSHSLGLSLAESLAHSLDESLQSQ